MIIHGTPWETYSTRSGRTVYVKREDLCCAQARFSKLRGVEAHLRSRSASVVGVLDTRHSKAGWGVAYIARELGRKCVVYYPVFKHLRGLRLSQLRAKEQGAELVGLPATRSCILYHQASADLRERYADSYMLPNALKLPESVEETAQELVQSIIPELLYDTAWVVSVSSGTIAAGVVKGLEILRARVSVVLHLGYSREDAAVLAYVRTHTSTDYVSLQVLDEGYEYADAVRFGCPFPCNPYYDLKAWKWLDGAAAGFPEKKIVFWNIGE